MAELKPDAAQVILGHDMLMALHDVGILPPDVYTRRVGPEKGAVVIDVDETGLVTLRADLVVPLDKFRRALELVEERRARVAGPPSPEE